MRVFFVVVFVTKTINGVDVGMAVDELVYHALHR